MKMMNTNQTWKRGGMRFTVAALIGLLLAMQPAFVPAASAAEDDGNHEAGLRAAEQLSKAFQHAAETIRPSVVSISSRKRVAGNGRTQVPDELRRFFGDDFFERFGPPGGGEDGFVQQGLGTGIIVSKDGYILTNNHVVEGADAVTVILHDERRYEAEIVGTDPKTDVAVLQIDAGPLKAAKLGNSDNLSVGGWVIAVGSPFGLRSTITAGIVSATGRSSVGIADYEDFIQTDAAINPGNSGGPLVNLRGEVVGINTAISTRSGGSMGVGFAIPVNMARSVMKSLIEDGRVVRGFLGVIIQNLNENLANSFEYDGTDGALVARVQDGSPADQAGLREGDIIMEIDGQSVEDVDELRFAVAETKPGTKSDLVIFRDGERQTVTVEIGELDAEQQTASRESGDRSLDLGMQYRTLSPEIAQRLGYDEAIEGVVITGVEPLSPADRKSVV